MYEAKNPITQETRSEAAATTNKAVRMKQILDCLAANGEMTAKDVAVWMYRMGFTPSAERNFSAPRLTELEEQGLVKVVGKTVCKYTGKKVAVYALATKEESA